MQHINGHPLIPMCPPMPLSSPLQCLHHVASNASVMCLPSNASVMCPPGPMSSCNLHHVYHNTGGGCVYINYPPYHLQISVTRLAHTISAHTCIRYQHSFLSSSFPLHPPPSLPSPSFPPIPLLPPIFLLPSYPLPSHPSTLSGERNSQHLGSI